MLKLLLVGTLSIASAFNVPPAKPAVAQLKLESSKEKALGLRGGADASQIAKYLVCFTAGFMFLPAGRDVISPGAEIMPDDDKLLGKMFTDTTKAGYTFMWNQWGVNWIMLSIMKILAVSSGNTDFMKLGFATDVATFAMMFKGWIPEFKPFVLMFGLELVALGKLAFA